MIQEDNKHSSNKRIAVNTLMLYGRMIFLTLINIYTVRVTLECLGDMDYGIYEAIASFIGALSFLNGTMTSATQRFLSYHLGKGDHAGYSHVFSMFIVCFLAFAALMIIVGELFGHLMVYDVLNIPSDRLDAALWVYRFTIISLAFNFLSIPFTAQIVANEKMGAFAYFSIADGLMKLIIVILLLHIGFDRLVLYAGLLALQTILIVAIYFIYCRIKFSFCRFKFRSDRMLLKELGAYTGWNLFGSISGMLVVQGQGVLLNIFFGPLVNTAKGVANRIYNVIISFAVNMFMAFSPQIVKSYASGEHARMHWLAMQSSRFSFLLLLILTFPLIMSMEPILNIWLGKALVTPLMIRFSQLMMIYSLVQALEPPITQMIRATGNIKEYQLKVGVWTLMYIPICIVFLWFWHNAILTMIILITLYLLIMAIRLHVADKVVNFPVRKYLKSVVWPISRVTAVLAICGLLLSYWKHTDGLLMLAAHLAVCFLITAISIWLLGLSVEDRQTIIHFIQGKLKRKGEEV